MINEVEEDHSNDLVWVKLAALYWLAKVLRKLGELTVIRLFDEDETEQTVENIKQAEAELGQAQPKLRLRLKLNDFNIWLYE